MSTASMDLGDVQVRMSHGELHGLPVVHEVHRTPVKLVRSLYYVEGMALLRMNPEQRRLARKCQSTDGQQFEQRLKELADKMKEEKTPAARPRDAHGRLLSYKEHAAR